MNGLLVFAALLTLIFYLICLISKRKFGYWKTKNVPHLKPLPILGNYGKYILQQQYPGHLVQNLCLQFPEQPYFGAFYGTEPVLVVQSPEIIKLVLTKDFYFCSGREASKYASKELVTRNIFFASGDRWKIIRQNLTPLFTSTKMKNMFYLIEKYAHVFEDMLDYEISISDVIEARDISARFTMDCICSCAFGVEANVMGQDAKNPFRIIAREIFEASAYRGFKILSRAVWPAIFYGLGFTIFPPSIGIFFSNLLKGVFKSRDFKPSARNDFVDLVLSLKKQGQLTSDSLSNAKTGEDKKVHLQVDDDLLVAQCIVFFAAGFDTSASTMSFTLFEFAKNQEVQRRAAEEVDEYLRRNGNKLKYECVNDLPYLDACIYETLRKYPVIGNLTREVMDDYVLPTGLQLDKGVRIHIPVFHMHHHPGYFSQPEKYKPERFLPENKEDLKPYTFFPYGEGPRICIGKRFSKMQVTAGLVGFLKKYRVELAVGMSESVPLDPRTFLIQPKDLAKGLRLKVVEREGWETKKFVRT